MTERRGVAALGLFGLLPAPPARRRPQKFPRTRSPAPTSPAAATAAKNASFRFAGFTVELKAGAHVTGTSYFYDSNRLIDALDAKCGRK